MGRKIPFGTIAITEKSKKIIIELLDSKRVSQGRLVNQFENEFAKIIGTKEAVAVASGTDADILALASLYDLGAKRNEEIIIPALTFVATANSVIHAGFKPVFVDVERETYNINHHKIEEKITKKTRAIMPVHLMGKPAEMDTIMNIAKKYNLYVIEDAAEAHGAKYKGRVVGSIGDASAFSLYLAHIISTVEGGIIGTSNSAIAEASRSLRSHGRSCVCSPCNLNVNSGYCKKRFKSGSDARFEFNRIGYSAKMNEIEAAVGIGNIEIYHDIVKKRKENLDYLIDKFQQFKPKLLTFKEKEYEVIGPHAFPVVLNNNVGFNRDEYANYLEKNGVETRVLFASIPTQYKSYKYLNHRLGEFPNAEYLGDNGIHIGVHQDLTKEDLDYFLEVTNEFLKEKNNVILNYKKPYKKYKKRILH